MEAALELIGTRGWSQTSMRAVCERAQVGPRFLYESFADLDDLAVAVFDEIVTDALAKVIVAIGAYDTLEDRVRVALDVLIKELTDDPRRARLLFGEARASEALAQRRGAALQTLAGAFLEQGRAFLGDVGEGERFLQPGALLLAGGVAELVLAWTEGDVPLTRDELTAVCAETLLAVGRQAPAIARDLATADRPGGPG